jgi:urea transport system permease protein
MTSATSSASVTTSGSGTPPDTGRATQSGFALGLPPRPALLTRPAWLALIALIIAIGLGVPLSALVLPETSAFHLSAYMMTLTGKFMCYAIGALALDLVWGYCGILSLGHALFFALGGYAIGMYLMRSIGHQGVYQSDLPDFMVFLNWHALPWYWEGTQHLWYALLLVVLVPAVIAWVFGFFTFRSRVKGVYLSIITQAMTFAAMLLFYRNETGFGGNNGFTDFKTIGSFPITHPGTRTALFLITFAVLVLAFLGARAIVTRRDRRARRRDTADVPRLQPAWLQTVYLDRLGDPVRNRWRVIRTAGRDYQSGRDVAGQFDRDGDLGGGGRTRHADRADHRRVCGEWCEELFYGELP